MPTSGFEAEASTRIIASFVQAACHARTELFVPNAALCTASTSAKAFDRGGSLA